MRKPSTSISGNTTTINSEHERGSVTIGGFDPAALANSHEMNLPVQTLKTSVTSLSGPVEDIFEFPAKQDLAPICV